MHASCSRSGAHTDRGRDPFAVAITAVADGKMPRTLVSNRNGSRSGVQRLRRTGASVRTCAGPSANADARTVQRARRIRRIPLWHDPVLPRIQSYVKQTPLNRREHEAARSARKGEGTASRPDAIIAAIAAEQYGIVTRMQLIRAGVFSHLVDGRVKLGRLRPAHAGIYQVGPVVVGYAREMAAVLVCDGAVLSHRTAGALRKMVQPQNAAVPVDVTLPVRRQCRRLTGIRAHRSDLSSDEIDRIERLPVTSAARTLLDLTHVASARELERALALALREGLTTLDHIRSLLSRHNGRAGTRRLRDLIEKAAPPSFTRSEAEEQLLALIGKGGLPEPELNVMLHGNEVDCFWRNARLAVEVDGYAFHGSRQAFLRDRQRDIALAGAGIHVIRLSWEQLTREREKTLVHLAQALLHARPR